MQTLESEKLAERTAMMPPRERGAEEVDLTALEKEPSAEQLTPRCNVPINLNNWKELPEEVIEELTWFHQHIFDDGLSNEDASKALGYDWTVIFRALKGTYKGNWQNITASIRRYRKLLRERKKIQNALFVPNRNTRLICDALDYTVASNTICLIIGESGMSKSMALQYWRDHNNSGRTILFEVPESCSPMRLLRAICAAIGRKPGSYEYCMAHIEKALNKGRTLIADEAHSLLPGPKASPLPLEILRRIHDRTKCGLAIVATARFGDDLLAAEYQYEQLLRRIGLPCRLFRTLADEDIRPLLEQYFARVTDLIIDTSLGIVNNELPDYKGRYGTLVEILRHASRMTADERGPRKMTEKHFIEALAVRKKMMGEFQYAKH